jgi:hypothetical protein
VHRPSTRPAASQPRGARVGGVGGVGAPGPATRAAAAVGAIARRNAGASTGRIDRTLAVGIAPSGSPRAMRSAAVILNASNDDDDENDASERVNLDLDDDPFEHVALPPIDDAAFDAMLDDIIEDDDEAEGDDASSAPAGSYSMPGDELPWDASGAWPEFDALLGKLMAKGYKIEVDPVASDGPGEGAVDTSVSTPEWARAVAESYEDEDETRTISRIPSRPSLNKKANGTPTTTTHSSNSPTPTRSAFCSSSAGTARTYFASSCPPRSCTSWRITRCRKTKATRGAGNKSTR